MFLRFEWDTMAVRGRSLLQHIDSPYEQLTFTMSWLTYKIWGFYSDSKRKVKDNISVPLTKVKTARHKMKTQMSNLRPSVSCPVNPNDKSVTFTKEIMCVCTSNISELQNSHLRLICYSSYNPGKHHILTS